MQPPDRMERATDLAKQIAEEARRTEPDWHAVKLWALELAAVSSRIPSRAAKAA